MGVIAALLVLDLILRPVAVCLCGGPLTWGDVFLTWGAVGLFALVAGVVRVLWIRAMG